MKKAKRDTYKLFISKDIIPQTDMVDIDNKKIEKELSDGATIDNFWATKILGAYKFAEYFIDGRRYINFLYKNKFIFDTWFDGLYYSGENGKPPYIVIRATENYSSLKFNFIDKNFNLVFDEFMDSIKNLNPEVENGTFEEKCFVLSTDSTHKYLLDENGMIISDACFSSIGDAWVKDNNEYLIAVNEEGFKNIFDVSNVTFLFKEWFQDIRVTSNFYIIKQHNNWNIMDVNTKQIMLPVWVDSIEPTEGIFEPIDNYKAVLENKFNYIKSDGTFLLKKWADWGESFIFNGDVVDIMYGDKVFILHRDGQIETSEEYCKRLLNEGVDPNANIVIKNGEVDIEAIKNIFGEFYFPGVFGASDLNTINDLKSRIRIIVNNIFGGMKTVSARLEESHAVYVNIIKNKRLILQNEWATSCQPDDDLKCIILKFYQNGQNILLENGEMLFPENVEHIICLSFEEYNDEEPKPVIVVENKNKVAVLDSDFKLIMDTLFDSVNFDDEDDIPYTGCICVKLNNKWNFLNVVEKKFVFENWVDELYPLYYTSIYVIIKNGKCNLYSCYNNTIILKNWVDNISSTINEWRDYSWCKIESGGLVNLFDLDEQRFILPQFVEKIITCEEDDYCQYEDDRIGNDMDGNIFALVEISNNEKNFIDYLGHYTFGFNFQDCVGVPVCGDLRMLDGEEIEPHYATFCLLKVNNSWNIYTTGGDKTFKNGFNDSIDALDAFKEYAQVIYESHSYKKQNLLSEERITEDEIKEHFLNFLERSSNEQPMMPPFSAFRDSHFSDFFYEKLNNIKTVSINRVGGLKFSNVIGKDGKLMFDEWALMCEIDKSLNCIWLNFFEKSNIVKGNGELVFPYNVDNVYAFEFEKSGNPNVIIAEKDDKCAILDDKFNLLFDEFFKRILFDEFEVVEYCGCFVVKNFEDKYNVFLASTQNFMFNNWAERIILHNGDYFEVTQNGTTNFYQRDKLLISNIDSIEIGVNEYYDYNWCLVEQAGKYNYYSLETNDFILPRFAESLIDCEAYDLSDYDDYSPYDGDEWSEELYAIVKYKDNEINFIDNSGRFIFNFNFQDFCGLPRAYHNWADNKLYALLKVNNLWNYYVNNGDVILEKGTATKEEAIEAYEKARNITTINESVNIDNVAKIDNAEVEKILASPSTEKTYAGYKIVLKKFNSRNFKVIMLMNGQYNCFASNILVGKKLLYEKWFSKRLVFLNETENGESIWECSIIEPGDDIVKFNLLNDDGNLILPYFCDNIQTDEWFFTIKNGTRYNAVDFNGNVLLNEWSREYFCPEKEGYFPIMDSNGNCKFITLKNQNTNLIFDDYKNDHNSYPFCSVKKHNRWNILNRLTGEITSKIWFDEIYSLGKGPSGKKLFMVKLSGKTNFIDEDGKMLWRWE